MCIRDSPRSMRSHASPSADHQKPLSYPVSYTHLDVYKRQYYHLTKEKVPKRKSAAAGIACGREGGKGGAKERRLRRLKAVSYTHLDVYKRQYSCCGS